MLKNKGIENIRLLYGGFDLWNELGYELEPAEPASR